MTRSVALRASICFVIFTLSLGVLGLGSHAMVAQAALLVAGALGAVLALFAVCTPAPQAIPLRARRQRDRRDPRA
jgi:membrane associated rhomboid family serine protease